MNNQDVSVERFFRVSSIVYRVSSIEYRVSSIVYRVSSANSIHDTRCIRVSSIECQLTFSRYCILIQSCVTSNYQEKKQHTCRFVWSLVRRISFHMLRGKGFSIMSTASTAQECTFITVLTLRYFLKKQHVIPVHTLFLCFHLLL